MLFLSYICVYVLLQLFMTISSLRELHKRDTLFQYNERAKPKMSSNQMLIFIFDIYLGNEDIWKEAKLVISFGCIQKGFKNNIQCHQIFQQQ